jgi:hypothetical protein
MSCRGRLYPAILSYRVCAVSFNSAIDADEALAALGTSRLNARRYANAPGRTSTAVQQQQRSIHRTISERRHERLWTIGSTGVSGHGADTPLLSLDLQIR